MESITEAAKAGTVRARVDDLVAGLRSPGDNERLIFLSGLFRSRGVDPGAADGAQKTGVFIYDNLQRVLRERKTPWRIAPQKPEKHLNRAE